MLARRTRTNSVEKDRRMLYSGPTARAILKGGLLPLFVPLKKKTPGCH
jgi:hypothetical protein